MNFSSTPFTLRRGEGRSETNPTVRLQYFRDIELAQLTVTERERTILRQLATALIRSKRVNPYDLINPTDPEEQMALTFAIARLATLVELAMAIGE